MFARNVLYVERPLDGYYASAIAIFHRKKNVHAANTSPRLILGAAFLSLFLQRQLDPKVKVASVRARATYQCKVRTVRRGTTPRVIYNVVNRRGPAGATIARRHLSN